MKYVLIVGLLLTVLPVSGQADKYYEQFSHLSSASLFGRACERYNEGKYEESIKCFTILAGRYTGSMSREEKEMCAAAYMNVGEMLFVRGLYSPAFTFTFKSIRICESDGFDDLMPRLQNTMGNIYNAYNEKNMSVKYYEAALRTARETHQPVMEVAALKNLSGVCSKVGQTDKAVQYRRQMLELAADDSTALYFGYLSQGYIDGWKNNGTRSRRHFLAAVRCSESYGLEPKYMASAYSALAGSFRKSGLLDSAVYYYEKNHRFCADHRVVYVQKTVLQELMGLYRETGNTAGLERLQREYAVLLDSLMKTDEFNTKKNDQFIYEISRNFEEITRLTRESEQKEAAIERHRTIMAAALCVLLFFAVMWSVVYRQKRRINGAYHDLFQRNRELLDQYEELRSLKVENSELKSAGTDGGAARGTDGGAVETENAGPTVKLSAGQRESLLKAIAGIMEDTGEYCQPKFSLEKLAEAVGSNSRYVSQIINETYGKNFRTFVNEFRIREASRRLLDTARYGNFTIKGVGESVGFKSYANFTETFRKITGMTPSVYLKLAREEASKTAETATDS